MQVQYPVSLVVNGEAFIAVIRIPSASSTSRPLRDQIAPAHPVVGGGAEAKQPVDEPSAAVAQLAEERDGLQPPERLLNELPFLMRRSRCGRAQFVLGHVRGDAHPWTAATPARVSSLGRRPR